MTDADEPQGDEPVTSEGPAEPDPTPDPMGDDPAEARYKRFTAITLAVLAVLAGWITLLNADASTNESATTREATRLASTAQAAAVIEAGAASARAQADNEIANLGLRPGFASVDDAATDLGITLDPADEAARLSDAEDTLRETTGGDLPDDLYLELQIAARETSLSQTEMVAERITWNARASQYETVLTVLGVAIFLLGFSLVLHRRIRPPLAIPGMILAVVCLGWAIHIYRKPIPDVPPAAIAHTAEGQALSADGRFDESIDAFGQAIDADDTYFPALGGRGLAQLVQANPDVLLTTAFTDTTGEGFQRAVEDLDAALEHGGDEDVQTLAIVALAAAGSGDWDHAIDALSTAIDRNSLTPGLQFGLSAAEAARGNAAEARRWRDQAVAALGTLDGSDTQRARFAQYATLLRRVAELEPEQAELADALAREAVVAQTEQAIGRPVTGVVPEGAAVGLDDLTFADGKTTVDLDTSNVPDDAAVTIVGYEVPAEGATAVQPAELFFAGFVGEGAPIDLATSRTCAPTGWILEVYLEGVRQPALTHPGIDATC